MRNLKRALSLALATVMLLGMMVMGTSAASNFTDAADIVNTEAVEITAGLGLFAGTGGMFVPQGTVTRAQMATIIVKMLYGSDFNADSFKGSGVFTDTAAFESGWAEGYISLCSSMGIVKGYGDGTFRPGQAVNTAEAVTMLINALKVDAGEGTWPHTVMAKAEEMKLYGDMTEKPGSYDALIRDKLAVMVLEALQYSPEGIKGYMANGKLFSEYLAAYLAAGMDETKVTPAAKDSLAATVFKLKTMEGVISDNQATGAEYTELTVGNTFVKFDLETGLEDIGHYVTVYYDEVYQTADKPGVAYAVVDDCTVVTIKEEAADTFAEYKAAFGTKAVPMSQDENRNADVNLVVDYEITGTGAIANYNAADPYYAPVGTYVIYQGEIVSYMAPATQIATQVTRIDNTAGEETITLRDVNDYQPLENNADMDEIDEYVGIAKEDYVIATKTGANWSVAPVSTVTGTIDRIYAVDGVDALSVNGTEYIKYTAGSNSTQLEINTANIRDLEATYILYVTEDGKYVGWEQSGTTGADLSVLRYIVGAYTQTTKDAYGEQTTYVYAQGADMNGKEVQILLGVKKADNTSWGVAPGTELTEGFYTVEKLVGLDREGSKLGIQTVTPLSMTYNKDTNPYLMGTNYWASTSSVSINIGSDTYLTAHICNENCVWTKGVHSGTTVQTTSMQQTTYYSDSAKYLAVDGELGEPLNVSLLTGFKHKATKTARFQMLFTKSENGAPVVTVVLIREDPANVDASGNAIYFTEEQLTPNGVNANGVVFQGYDGLTGKPMELTLPVGTEKITYMDGNNEVEGTKGYYRYTIEDGIATIRGKATGNVSTNAIVESEFGGKINGTGELNADTYTKAVVVDTRSEDAMNQSGVKEITSMEQLIDLTLHGDHKIYFDAYGSSANSLATIFVVDAATTKPGTYYMPTNALVGWNQVYTLDGNTIQLYTSKASDFAGFVNHDVDAAGELVVTQANVANTFTGEAMTGYNADTGMLTSANMTAKLTANTKLINLSTNGDLSSMDKLVETLSEGGKLVFSAVTEGAGENKVIKTIFVISVDNLNVEDGDLLYVQSIDDFNDETMRVKAWRLTADGFEELNATYTAVDHGRNNEKNINGGFYEVGVSAGTATLTFKDPYDSALYQYHNAYIKHDASTMVTAYRVVGQVNMPTKYPAGSAENVDGHVNATAANNECGLSCAATQEKEPARAVSLTKYYVMDLTGNNLDTLEKISAMADSETGTAVVMVNTTTKDGVTFIIVMDVNDQYGSIYQPKVGEVMFYRDPNQKDYLSSSSTSSFNDTRKVWVFSEDGASAEERYVYFTAFSKNGTTQPCGGLIYVAALDANGGFEGGHANLNVTGAKNKIGLHNKIDALAKDGSGNVIGMDCSDAHSSSNKPCKITCYGSNETTLAGLDITGAIVFDDATRTMKTVNDLKVGDLVDYWTSETDGTKVTVIIINDSSNSLLK